MSMTAPDDERPDGDQSAVWQENERKMEAIREGIDELYSKNGMYQRYSEIHSAADLNRKRIGSIVDDGDQVVIRTIFEIKDIAWSDRVLKPDKHAEDTMVHGMLPTEEEALLPDVIEKLKRFSLGDDETGDNDGD